MINEYPLWEIALWKLETWCSYLVYASERWPVVLALCNSRHLGLKYILFAMMSSHISQSSVFGYPLARLPNFDVQDCGEALSRMFSEPFSELFSEAFPIFFPGSKIMKLYALSSIVS